MCSRLPGRQGVLLDGHTRLQAALSLGIKDVPVSHRPFASEDEAVEYTIHSQADRRNLSDSEIARLVGVLDKRKERGGDHKSNAAKSKAQRCAIDPNTRKSASDTAATLGTSARKVEQVRTIMDHGKEESPPCRAGVSPRREGYLPKNSREDGS